MDPEKTAPETPDTVEPLPNPEHDAMGYALAAAQIIHRAVLRALTPLVQVVNAYGKEIDKLKEEARGHIPEAEVAPLVVAAVANATSALEAELAAARAATPARADDLQLSLDEVKLARSAAHHAVGSAMGMAGNAAEAFFLLEQKFARVAFALEQQQQRQAAPKVE